MTTENGAESEKSGKWCLKIGYHSGTMMTRDLCDPMKLDSLEDCIKELKRTENSLKKNGHYVWWAVAISPSSEEIKIHEGTPYCR